MKIKKKSLLFLFAALLSVNIITTYAFAASIPANTTDENIITPRAEETEWVFRDYNGVIQKRLWSRTYARWLTDWINV